MSMAWPETPSQTAGPFLHIGLTPEEDGVGGIRPLSPVLLPGKAIHLYGKLLDAENAPVADGLIEMWQIGGGWARSVMDEEGRWQFDTTRPDTMAFVNFWIVARGINTGLHTRFYFPDTDWYADAGMSRVPDERRRTLVASDEGDGAYRLDIHLGGEHETVFFDV